MRKGVKIHILITICMNNNIIVITDDGYFVKQILFSSDVETVQGI